MKLKLTLSGSGREPVDLVATVDAGATIGDLASYLSHSDPRHAVVSSAGSVDDVTLAVVGRETLALDSRVPIADSGLHSGVTVALSRGGQAYRDPDATADAILTVVEGPDAGREFRLHRGANVIGREAGCEVLLSDPLVSRQHARVNVTDVVEILDLGSANGVVIGSGTVPRSTVRAGDAVQVGDTVFTVHVVTSETTVGVESTSVSFIRSPRLDPRYEGEELEAPEPPEPAQPARFPVIALIAPVIVGAVLFAITKSAASLAFVALSPLMLIGNAVESRLSRRSGFKKALASWRASVAELVATVKEASKIEVHARNAEHPSVADCLDAARSLSPLLWTRRPGERGFAELRLGTGRLASRTTIKMPEARKAPRELVAELHDALAPLAAVDGVPVVAELAERGAVGVAGDRRSLLGAARGLVAQAVVLHSPAELVVAAFGSAETAPDWEWLKWLPHTSSSHSPIPVRHLVAARSDSTRLVSELEDVLEHRRAEESSSLPAVLVLVEHDAAVEHSRLVQLAELGPEHGIYVMWLARDVARLPAACRTFLEIAGSGPAGAVGFVHSGDYVEPVSVELVDAAAVDALARKMAPVVDIGARVEDESDLPRAVSLLTLTGPTLATSHESIIERWTESSSILTGPFAPAVPPRRTGTLRAVIGQSAGEPLALDLRADGPHALVGGTTGSGKSELLQAWILGMASSHSPQRLTFLLVDYKGGSAFRDCTNLPHTIGLVTDLSPHLVRRALTSLKAELQFREHLLAKHASKDLASLEKLGVVDAPPSLVIVVDEFAALVTEVPEFVDGVVDVAQRGRSLGLHLILATQRPAGVIKDNLRANTNLRIALRMADESDSTDVLGSPEAAFFDQAIPGRAVSKTGPGRLVPFQTAYAGGWTTEEPPPPDMLVEELVFGEGRVWEPLDADGIESVDDEGETDIKRLTATIGIASERADIPIPRKPWLPELKHTYDLADQTAVPSLRRDTDLVYGVADDPEHQAQPTLAFRPDRDGNLAVYGTGGSGKSTLLRTLAIAAGFTVRGGPCHVYGLDFGARGLSMLEELPHVGSIIDGSDHERITRLLGWLRSLVDERALRYSRTNASTITDYRSLASAPDEPRILLLIDGVAAFRQAYEASDRVRWFDTFTSIATDGRPVGVHVILSSEQRAGMTTALASAVQARVVLRLASEDDYGMLNVPSDVLSVQSPPGRALVGESEAQVAVLGGTPDVVNQALTIKGFAESMRRAGSSTAPPIERLPERIALAEVLSTNGGVSLGIASSTLAPFTIEPRGTFIVSGPPGSGRTTTMLSLVEALHASRPLSRLVYLGNRRSPLAALEVWSTKAFGPTEIADAAATLASQLVDRNDEGLPTAVFVEGVGDLAGGPADAALQELVKVCLAEDHFVVVEGETSTLSTSFGVVGVVKSSRAGLALAPDQADGTTVYRTNFPRVNRAEYPPGRALYVALGRTEVVQIGVPAHVV